MEIQKIGKDATNWIVVPEKENQTKGTNQILKTIIQENFPEKEYN